MNETCDRCGPAVLAAYRLERRAELYLCRGCASRHWPALAAQGWSIWVACERALAPQEAMRSAAEPMPALSAMSHAWGANGGSGGSPHQPRRNFPASSTAPARGPSRWPSDSRMTPAIVASTFARTSAGVASAADR